MKILKNIEVPTGNIVIVQGEKGSLEMLSLGDYGQDVNIKCDALGLTREIERVEHQQMLPLTEKWVITVSTQYGCSMRCTFCDVPKVGPGINATENDLLNQFRTGLALHPEIESTKRVNVHYARMGEPTWNPNVLKATYGIWRECISRRLDGFHPVISTMMPKNNEWLELFLDEWMRIKNDIMHGEAGLQLSINSTDDEERNYMFSNNCHNLKDISEMMARLIVRRGIKGRKITLNFALAGYTIDAEKLADLFDPTDFIVKITPMHKTKTALANGIETEGNYTEYEPYHKVESELKAAGFDVLVFIASEAEDMGRITCGNAILSGTMPETEYKIK